MVGGLLSAMAKAKNKKREHRCVLTTTKQKIQISITKVIVIFYAFMQASRLAVCFWKTTNNKFIKHYNHLFL